MREIRDRQKTKRIAYSLPSLVILSIITILLAKAGVSMMLKERVSLTRNQSLAEQSVALVNREQELREEIEYLKTEEGIKDEIKEKFSVTQKGEHVAVIVDNKNSSSSLEETGPAWYQRFWNAIMRKK